MSDRSFLSINCICKGCGTAHLFMCTHDGVECGYGVSCCPARKALIASLPEDQRDKAARAIELRLTPQQPEELV